MSDWKVKRQESACAGCAHAFEEGEAYFSILTIDGEALGREDRCAPCFPAPPEGPAEERARERIWWRTRRRPRSRRGLAVDFEAIEALFLALDGHEADRLRELRYLLSLLLMRKRRLKLVRVLRSGEGEAMVVRRPRRQEEQRVDVFDLTPERMDALRRELERIVEGAGAEDVLAGPPAALEPEQADLDEVEGDADDAADALGSEPADPELSTRA